MAVRALLNREIVVTSRTTAGQSKDWKNMQPVLKYEFKFPIAAKVPDLVAEDFTLRLTAGVPNVDCEEGKFLYYNDVVEDGRAVPQ